jgi:RHS repeat-associated protein
MKKITKHVFQTLLLFVSIISGHAISGETVTYYHLDNLGSPVAASDEAGNLKWSEQYQPYGGRILKEGDGQNDIWFTGKQEDIGLSYMGARWYDPQIGRFLAIDPVGFTESNPQSFNRYAYANNNPYRYVDPNGESPIDIGFLIWDVGKLGIAIYSGHGVGAAAMDVLDSAIGVASPIPGVGIGLKIRRAEKIAEKAKSVANKGKRISGKNPPINKDRQNLHANGVKGSQFKEGVDVDNLVQDAWHTGTPEFNKNGKLIGKVKTYKNAVGEGGQKSVDVRFNRKKGIHGFASNKNDKSLR